MNDDLIIQAAVSALERGNRFGYLLFAIYTWVAPPLLRFWLKRRVQL